MLRNNAQPWKAELPEIHLESPEQRNDQKTFVIQELTPWFPIEKRPGFLF